MQDFVISKLSTKLVGNDAVVFTKSLFQRLNSCQRQDNLMPQQYAIHIQTCKQKYVIENKAE
mgnify:CR=1 FL=1